MNTILVVVRDFGPYKRGMQIDDQVKVAEILKSTNAANVVVRQIGESSKTTH